MELVLKLEMKIVWSSSATLGVPPFLLNFNYFMFNLWWIPYNFMGGVIWWLIECGRWLNLFTESVYVYSSVSSAICYHISYWTLNCFYYPSPLPLGVQFTSCWQIQLYSVTHLETSLLQLLVVGSLLVMCCINHVSFYKIVQFWQLAA